MKTKKEQIQSATSLDNTIKTKKVKKNNEQFDCESWILDKYIAKFGYTTTDFPENSLGAFSLAVKKGYTNLIAVQKLKDDNIVCFKDKTFGRLTKQNGYVANATTEELKNLKLLKTNEGVCTLKEALEVIKGKQPVIIYILNEELVGKTEESILKILNDYSEQYNCKDLIAIMSINPYTLQWFSIYAPNYVRILKSCYFKNLKFYGQIKTKKLKKLKFLKISNADFLAYSATNLPNKYIKKAKTMGVIAYDVTSQEEYLRLLPYCENIIFSGFEPKI